MKSFAEEIVETMTTNLKVGNIEACEEAEQHLIKAAQHLAAIKEYELADEALSKVAGERAMNVQYGIPGDIEVER